MIARVACQYFIKRRIIGMKLRQHSSKWSNQCVWLSGTKMTCNIGCHCLTCLDGWNTCRVELWLHRMSETQHIPDVWRQARSSCAISCATAETTYRPPTPSLIIQYQTLFADFNSLLAIIRNYCHVHVLYQFLKIEKNIYDDIIYCMLLPINVICINWLQILITKTAHDIELQSLNKTYYTFYTDLKIAVFKHIILLVVWRTTVIIINW